MGVAAPRIENVESILFGGAHFVRITTDDGVTGLGQSACWAYPKATAQVVASFRDYLIGQDPARIEHHWQYLYRLGPFRGSILSAAVSAVDIALWDIKGKRLQAPIWELLGGRCRDRIRLHLLMEGESAGEIAVTAGAAAAEGFTAVKLDPLPAGYQDLGLARLIEEVTDRVAAARGAVGNDVDVIVELHRGLTPLQAFPVIEALKQFNPLFVEDPIQIDSIVSQAEIARRLTVPMGYGERLHTIWEFRELLAAGGPQFCRPDLGLAGGLTHCKKIAAVAEAFHATVVTHNFLGPVLTAASVHLDASIPNFLVQEYSKIDEGPAAAAFHGVLQRAGGYLPVVDRPGLGVELAEGFETTTATVAELADIPLRADGSVAYAV
jgi:galactonate dehydratase